MNAGKISPLQTAENLIYRGKREQKGEQDMNITKEIRRSLDRLHTEWALKKALRYIQLLLEAEGIRETEE